MSKNEEPTMITVINTDEFKKLPPSTQKLITKLTKDLKVSGLNLLNPLVESMVIIDGFKAIKYDAENAETIQQYKDAKATIRSFNASTRKAKKEIKAPLLATGKDLDRIEKTFLEEAKEIQEKYLDVEFKPYIDEEERKKEEALAKKNAATTAKIAELSEETTEQKIALERSNVFGKYSREYQEILNATIEKIDHYSIKALDNEKHILEASEFSLPEEHINTLLPDQVENLKASYNGIISTSLRLINSKIDDIHQKIELEKAKEKIESTENYGIKEMIAPVIDDDIPQVPGPDITFGENFKGAMEALIEYIGELPTTCEKEEKAKSSAVAGLGNYMLKILNFLNNEDGN